MEIFWKWTSFLYIILLCELCNGYPINLDEKITDPHTQLLTGLVGVLLTVCSIVFLAGCLCCQRRNNFKEFHDSPVVASVQSDLDHGHINPIASGEFTIFTPLSPPLFNNNVFLPREQIVGNKIESFIHEGTDLRNWFSESERDFPRIRLKYVRELGRGKFGKVVEGAAQDIAENGDQWTPVVVQILDYDCTQEEKLLFMKDALIYKCGSHPNILSLYGKCLDTVPFLLLQEHCQEDLKTYLRSVSSNKKAVPSAEYPLLWSIQLTSALKHIHHGGITHYDLAIRNCLLTSDLILKLGDYSLSISRYPGDYYQGVPIRWSDPESLVYQENIIKLKNLVPENNIWSLGVTLWEIFQCGEQPYSDLNDKGVISEVLNSNCRLERPNFTSPQTDFIYGIIQSCWSSPDMRPNVSQIHSVLTDLLKIQDDGTAQTLETCSSDDFDKKWNSLKPNSIVRTDLLSDSISIEMNDPDVKISKELSASLNNLHGSLDDLLLEKREPQLEIYFEDGLGDKHNFYDNQDTERSLCPSDFSDGGSSSKDKPYEPANKEVYQRTSSGSETEDENWRSRVERGAVTEKVRVKSRSVADLMILTHVDYSESESETPLQSLDYRVNYKNVRINSLENSHTFVSEGNLLSIEDTFQEELRKLQEERKDSLLFVPDSSTKSTTSNLPGSMKDSGLKESNNLSNSAKLLSDLSSPEKIQPTPQVFNVFNVTVDCRPPVCESSKLNDIINFSKPFSFESDSMKQITEQLLESKCDNNLLGEHSSTFPNNKPVPEQNRSDIINEEEIAEDLITLDKKQDSQLNSYTEIDAVRNEILDIHPDSSDANLDNLNESNDTCLNLEDLVISKEDKICKPETVENVAVEVEELVTENNECIDEIKLNPETEQLPRLDQVEFDLSANQEEARPNPLTHSSAFTSTPLKISKVSLISEDTYSSLNVFNVAPGDANTEVFSSNFVPPQNTDTGKNLSYSLETWDNFLGKTLECQEQSHENLFDSFSSEPRSLLFIDNEDKVAEGTTQVENVESADKEPDSTEKEDGGDNNTFTIASELNSSREGCENSSQVELNRTYTKDKPNVLDMSDNSWESGDGWFLHPQVNDDVSGEMEISSSSSESYVGFGIDDEIMSAIRNELLSKLPHAQGSNQERILDDSEWNAQETNEVFLRYNVYNTPLSPIPEESCSNDGSGSNTPKQRIDLEDEDSDWSGPCEAPQDTESQSAHTLEGLPKLQHHTPSEDSCCSNDTLFNLEELNCAAIEAEREHENTVKHFEEGFKFDETEDTSNIEPVNDLIKNENNSSLNCDTDTKRLNDESPEYNLPNVKNITNEFLIHEKGQGLNDIKSEELEVSTIGSSSQVLEQEPLALAETRDVPLPSAETKPDMQLSGALLSCETGDYVTSENETNVPNYVNTLVDESVDNFYENSLKVDTENHYENVEPEYENCEKKSPQDGLEANQLYDDYVNLVNMENMKNSLEYDSEKDTDYENIVDANKDDNNSVEDNTFSILTDIRFSGPTDNQLMSTSFSESNNCDEQEWDSGSESRSSSSGEFIWKEGEHEESLKALRAAPQDVLENLASREPTEDQCDESDVSSNFSDEDEETPGFIPSAWDKFAMPIKSALRSPEKTLNKKKAKVWFKKQKYHCIYEYPKEPESPVLQSQDLWKMQPDHKSFTFWEYDGECFSVQSDEHDTLTSDGYKSKAKPNCKSLYQLTDVSDFIPGNTGLEEEFFISSSTYPFDVTSASSSQFFPGSSNWAVTNTMLDSMENATPDSGVEDMTPGSQADSDEFSKITASVPTLKQLASECIKKNKQVQTRNEDVLGGLRHTRNKLKLDLPPSPSAFSTEKVFAIENNFEPVVREKPTFTTFGKSRFFVQQIDTPDDETINKNVSFEALPYTPLINRKEELHVLRNSDFQLTDETIKQNILNDANSDIVKLKIEVVRGEASLLDSADEDSGIESSTLERKISNI